MELYLGLFFFEIWCTTFLHVAMIHYQTNLFSLIYSFFFIHISLYTTKGNNFSTILAAYLRSLYFIIIAYKMSQKMDDLIMYIGYINILIVRLIHIFNFLNALFTISNFFIFCPVFSKQHTLK